jgi:hypothetical protein
VLITSCEKSESRAEFSEESQFFDKDWDRIRIPDGGQLQAVAGDIEDTLLVSTRYNTYMVTDKGKTFTLTSKHLNNTPGLYVSQDTIYALYGSSYDVRYEKYYSGGANYYTLDKGLNWLPSNPNRYLRMLNGVVSTKSNAIIQLNYHVGADQKGNGSNFVLRTTISKIENGFTSPFSHPIVDEQPINLYVDKSGRLYIPTGGSFSDTGVYMSASIMSPAYLYISKNPI